MTIPNPFQPLESSPESLRTDDFEKVDYDSGLPGLDRPFGEAEGAVESIHEIFHPDQDGGSQGVFSIDEFAHAESTQPLIRSASPSATGTNVDRRDESPQQIDAVTFVEEARRSARRSVPFTVRSEISSLMGRGVVPQSVFVSPATSQLADLYSADAVTVGDDIFVAQPTFAPDSDQGAALIAHETVHVRRSVASAPVSYFAEERRALDVEGAFVAARTQQDNDGARSKLPEFARSQPVSPLSFTQPPAPVSATTSVPASGVHTASSDRSAAANEVNVIHQSMTEEERKQLKEEVLQDLIAALHSEAERA